MFRKPFHASSSRKRDACLTDGNRSSAGKEFEYSLLLAIVEASDDAIVAKTLDGIITTWNPAAERMFGYTVTEIVGKSETILFPPDRLREEEIILTKLRYGISTDRFETIRLCKDGTALHVSVNISPIKDACGSVIGASTIARDITGLPQLNAQLQERMTQIEAQNAALEALATIDGLTGVKNHRALQEHLREEYDRALRYNTALSVLMLDVDRFKEYNVSYGRAAGDVVLRQVAQILQNTARACDIVARYGGEEFTILLPETGVDEAKEAAERFRHAIDTTDSEATAGQKWNLTVSIGVATMMPATAHPDALLADADAALNRSKNLGRNCVTHKIDPSDVETFDTGAAQWYDDLLQKLLATQVETLEAASERVSEALLKAYEATIVSWSRILDLKDKETEGHSERVTEMMVRLMQYLGFSETEIRFARWGAWLHDIGKMAVPDRILHKPGPLTEDEWAIMRPHTTIAYEMLQPIQFLGAAIDIPYCHHEKWDGSGYPRGLKGEEIPLMARLFAVIDVYDALTNDRPYRGAWPEENVRTYLQDKSGTQFDPRAVQAFLSMLAGDQIYSLHNTPLQDYNSL